MAFFTILRIIAVILGIVGSTLIIPLIVAICYGETQVILPVVIPMVCSWIFAIVMLIAGRGKKTKLSTKSSFVIVALSWIAASLFGAIPLYFSGAIPSITDAVFESVSGFTTTGATILSTVENLPVSMNLWRCLTHWLGGMGIVALTVALLPLLGVGGFQLIKAETTGPEKGKFTAKITSTAKTLWLIYFALTFIEFILLLIAGDNFVDAMSVAFATLGSGGFSTKNGGIGDYNSLPIEIIITVFMFLAGINFTMFYNIITGRFKDLKENTEFKTYLGICGIAVLLITFFECSTYGGFFKSLRYSSFQVGAIISTTGFGTADYTYWKPASQVIIFIMFFIGGCSGSTGGGVKVIRWICLWKQLKIEIKKMLHPHGVFTMQIDNKEINKTLPVTVAAFFAIWCIMIVITTFIACIFGVEIFTSFTGALSMVGNVGPAFGALGPSANYGWLHPVVKWWYSFAMIAGRLELFTMIIFFTPDYWKK